MVGFWESLWKMKNTQYYLVELEQPTIAFAVVMKLAL